MCTISCPSLRQICDWGLGVIAGLVVRVSQPLALPLQLRPSRMESDLVRVSFSWLVLGLLLYYAFSVLYHLAWKASTDRFSLNKCCKTCLWALLWGQEHSLFFISPFSPMRRVNYCSSNTVIVACCKQILHSHSPPWVRLRYPELKRVWHVKIFSRTTGSIKSNLFEVCFKFVVLQDNVKEDVFVVYSNAHHWGVNTYEAHVDLSVISFSTKITIKEKKCLLSYDMDHLSLYAINNCSSSKAHL